MNNIGKRIKQERTSKELTLDKLAELSGVSKTYLSELENNQKQNPSSDVLLKIAAALNVSLQYLIQGSSNNQSTSIPIPSSLKEYAIEADLKFSTVEKLFKLSNVALAHRGNKSPDQITKDAWKKIHKTLVEQDLLEE